MRKKCEHEIVGSFGDIQSILIVSYTSLGDNHGYETLTEKGVLK